MTAVLVGVVFGAVFGTVVFAPVVGGAVDVVVGGTRVSDGVTFNGTINFVLPAFWGDPSLPGDPDATSLHPEATNDTEATATEASRAERILMRAPDR